MAGAKPKRPQITGVLVDPTRLDAKRLGDVANREQRLDFAAPGRGDEELLQRIW